MILSMIPNMLSLARIALAIVLLFIDPYSGWFLLAYLTCGLTDVLDGYLARKLGATSAAGALMDAIGDLLMYGVILYLFLTVFTIPAWLVVWVVNLAAFRLLGWFISWVRLGRLVTHTYLDRFTGILLFALLPVLLFFDLTLETPALIVCTIATVATMEVLVLAFLSRKKDDPVYSVLHLRKK